MKCRNKKLLLSLVFSCVAGSYAEIAPPAWVSDSDVISVTYRFETGETEPNPSESANLIAPPYLLIDKVTIPSAGWAYPGYPFITRDNGGTWELGETGHMDLFLPLVEASRPDLYAEVFIEVIAASGLEVLPVLEMDAEGNVGYVTEVIEPDPLNMWHWAQQVWTGRVSLAASDNLSFSLICQDTTPYGDASTIDQIRVYSKVIPEPATGLLLGLAGVLFLARRHWRD